MRPIMRLATLSRTGRAALAAAGLLCLTLTGCGSSQPDYYTLSTWPGAAQRGGPLTLMIRTPAVAAYLDRDYIVRSAPGYTLKLADDAAWGSPLADMIGQTLSLDLQQRLPGTTVFTQTGAISTEAQAVVEVNISQFAQDSAGRAEIIASLLVQRPDSGPVASTPLHLTVSPDDKTVGALAAALSRMLGQVADEAAREARALGPPPAAPMPLETSRS